MQHLTISVWWHRQSLPMLVTYNYCGKMIKRQGNESHYSKERLTHSGNTMSDIGVAVRSDL